jgi:hypothetical protein
LGARSYLFNGLAGRLPRLFTLPGNSGGGASPSDNPFDTDQSTPKARADRGTDEDRIYVTYTKLGPDGQVYAGHSSGFGTPEQVVAARDAGHHIQGNGPAQLDRSATGFNGYLAIRGREQDIVDHYGGVGDPRVGNRINPISPINPLGPIYRYESSRRFGKY